MEYEKQLIWIIPNNEYSENNLEDGRGTFFPFMTGDRDHRSRCQEFCEEHKLSNYPVGGSHDDWGKYLTERGFIVFFNSGVTIDNKYFGALYLPAQLTEKQINFLEDRKELLEEKYNHNTSFLGIRVLASTPLDYRNNGFRDLQIESIIENCPSDDAIVLLYKEVNSQKENLKRKSL
jgi:hypothetical protein